MTVGAAASTATRETHLRSTSDGGLRIWLDTGEAASRYLDGLLYDSERKSMQAMRGQWNHLGQDQALQHFIKHAPWDAARSPSHEGMHDTLNTAGPRTDWRFLVEMHTKRRWLVTASAQRVASVEPVK